MPAGVVELTMGLKQKFCGREDLTWDEWDYPVESLEGGVIAKGRLWLLEQLSRRMSSHGRWLRQSGEGDKEEGVEIVSGFKFQVSSFRWGRRFQVSGFKFQVKKEKERRRVVHSR